MDSRNLVATLAGFVVAAAVLAALAYLVGIGDVLRAIGRADVGWVALVGAAILAWMCLWGAGLRTVLAATGTEIPLADAILVNAGASFANHVTPFGQAGGEPVAAWLLSDVSGADYERALAAVASFDTINVVPSLSFAAVGLAYYASVSTLGTRFRLIGVGIALFALVLASALYVGWHHREVAEALLARLVAVPTRALGRVIPRFDPPSAADVEERIERFVGGIERVASDRGRLGLALAFSTGGWLVQSLGLWFAFRALGVPIPGYVPLFVVPMGTVASVLPTPGGLGGIETVQVALLVATGTAAATATAAVAIFSVGGFFLTTTLGAASVAALQARERRSVLP
ncbi:MAG: YbhN family protein [Halobacteriaceae archaeon]